MNSEYICSVERGDCVATGELGRGRIALRAGAAIAFLAALSLSGHTRAQAGLDARPVEVAQLPTFCWAQLHIPNAEGDEFRIRDCGPSANHYCSGLLYLVRAKHAKRKIDALDGIRHADTNVAYTEDGIKNYPKCSIRD